MKTKEERLGRDFLIISMITVFATAVWTAVEIFQILKSDKEKLLLSKTQTEPLEAAIDVKALDELENYNYFELELPSKTLGESIEEPIASTESAKKSLE